MLNKQPVSTLYSYRHYDAAMASARPLPQFHTVDTTDNRAHLLDVILINLVIMSFIAYTLQPFSHLSDVSQYTSVMRWILLAIWILALILQVLATRRRAIYPVSGKISLIMLIWFLITIIVRTDFAFLAIEKLTAIFVIHLLAYLLLPRATSPKTLLKIFMISLVCQIAISVIYGYFMQESFLQFFQRHQGLFVNPNTLAIQSMVMPIFAVVCLLVNKRLRFLTQFLLGILALSGLLVLVGTGTRSALFSFLLSMFLWLFIWSNRHGFLLIIAVLVCATVLGGNIISLYTTSSGFGVRQHNSEEEYSSGRIERYNFQLEQISQHFLLGTGFASGASPFDEQSSRALDHSAILGAFVETGFVGGTLFLCWLISCLTEMYKFAARKRSDWVAQMGFVFVVFLILVSAVESHLMMAGNITIVAYYLLIGGLSTNPITYRLELLNKGVTLWH